MYVCTSFIYTTSISIPCVSCFYSFNSNTECCGHITCGVNIYLHACVGLSVFVCCVCLCVMLDQSICKNHAIFVKLELDVLLYKNTQQCTSATKVLRLDKSRSIISKEILKNKLTHWVWHNQQNNTMGG